MPGTKKEPPPSEDGSSSCLLLHHPALIAGASARLWVPDSVLHTLPRTGEGRFSLVIGFRLRLRRHAKGTCDFLIPHLHQWGTSGRYPMPFFKEGRAANHKSYAYAVGTSLPMDCQVVKCMELYRIPRPDSPEDWRAVLLLLSAIASSCPDVLVYPEPF